MGGGDLSACDFYRMQEVLSILHPDCGTGRRAAPTSLWLPPAAKGAAPAPPPVYRAEY